MQIKSAVAFSLAAVLFLLCGFAPMANADEAYFRGALLGQWRDPKTGDTYRFNSNQTYEFRAGLQKRKSGNLSHSGTWALYNPDPERPIDFKPYGLKLNATQRKILSRGRIVNRPADRVFELLFQRAYLNIPHDVQVYLSSNGRYYFREPNDPQKVHWIAAPEAEDPNRLLIGPVSFVRVK